jgi:stage V sporulation protein SpoVS
MTMKPAILISTFFFCLSACATVPAPGSQPEVAEAVPPARGDLFYEFAEVPSGPTPIAGAITGTVPSVGAAPIASTDPGAITNAITRKELRAFVAQGPRHALTLVAVQPAFQGQHFVGYQVTGVSQDGQRVFGDALRRGDVIISVNSRSIARPEDYMGVWQDLGVAKRVSVTLLRAGDEIAMSWPVID